MSLCNNKPSSSKDLSPVFPFRIELLADGQKIIPVEKNSPINNIYYALYRNTPFTSYLNTAIHQVHESYEPFCLVHICHNGFTTKRRVPAAMLTLQIQKDGALRVFSEITMWTFSFTLTIPNYLTTAHSMFISSDKFSSVTDNVMCIPHSIYLEGDNVPLVLKGSPIGSEYCRYIKGALQDNTEFFSFYEGENEIINENRHIGDITITKQPKNLDFDGRILVTIKSLSNKVFQITAKIELTGSYATIFGCFS